MQFSNIFNWIKAVNEEQPISLNGICKKVRRIKNYFRIQLTEQQAHHNVFHRKYCSELALGKIHLIFDQQTR